MKTLLLENPRRRRKLPRIYRKRMRVIRYRKTYSRNRRRHSRRLRRNYWSDYSGQVRTPLSPLYPNAGMSFESIFGKRKRKKSRKGKKRSHARKHKRTHRSRTGARRIRKNKTHRPTRRSRYRRHTMKIRTNRRRGIAGVKGFAGQFIKRENLSLAGGVLLAPIATGFVRRTINLPTLGSAQVSNALYGLLIPGLGALLTRRLSPALANGMIIGGIANVVSGLIPQLSQTATTQRYLGEYLDPRRGMGAYIAPQRTMGSAVPSAFNAWAK